LGRKDVEVWQVWSSWGGGRMSEEKKFIVRGRRVVELCAVVWAESADEAWKMAEIDADWEAEEQADEVYEVEEVAG